MSHPVLWLTGHSGAGKTTTAKEALRFANFILLDGDEMRKCISRGLGFSKEDRIENNTRVALLAVQLSKQKPVVVASIAPVMELREKFRNEHGFKFIHIKRDLPEREGHFYEYGGLYWDELDIDTMSPEKAGIKLVDILLGARR